jgi:hypothetical protein
MKHAGGRPSKFDTINQAQLKKLVLAGFDDSQVSDFFGVTEQSLNNYKQRYPKFFESLKDWKIEADKKVERSLYQRAIGYEYDEVTYEKTKTGGLGIGFDKGEVSDIKHVDTYKTKVTVKQALPDVTAQIFWLKNRKPAEWREKQEIDHKFPNDAKSVLEAVEQAETKAVNRLTTVSKN